MRPIFKPGVVVQIHGDEEPFLVVGRRQDVYTLMHLRPGFRGEMPTAYGSALSQSGMNPEAFLKTREQFEKDLAKAEREIGL